jgi:predicted phosphate transport protein (TIGR00153 family)
VCSDIEFFTRLRVSLNPSYGAACSASEKMQFKNVFGFFSRGERQILEKVIRNLDVSIDAAGHLLNLVISLKKYDYDAVNAEYRIIADLEEKGDELHRTLVREIATESFFGGIREDFLNLLEKIDSIADEAKDAGKIFHQRHVPKEMVDYLFRGDVVSFISTCVKTTELFRESILTLEKDKRAVLSLVEKVEESEEVADTIRYAILEHLFKNEIRGDVLDIIMLKDFLNTADDVADNAEDGSDILQIIRAKGYS